jgi:polysaccharide chain length determinant protein (PEP-CTERM system associated)
MNPVIERVKDEIRSTWRFRWQALGVAAVIAILGWTVVFTLPDQYEATARVFVDTRTALKPVLQSLAVDQNVSGQLNYVRQSLLAGPQLQRIAEQSGVLPAGGLDPVRQERLLKRLSESVMLQVRDAGTGDEGGGSGGTVYSVTYRDNDRTRALNVVRTLVSTFVDETLGGKRAGSENAQKFLESQLLDYEQRLKLAESRLAEFKEKNIGLMPTEQGGYFAQLQTELDAVHKSETDLAVAESRRAELAKQLRGEAAVTSSAAPVAHSGNGMAAGDSVSRIREAQAKLDELLLQFTDKHPDVIAARAALDELQRRRAIELESLQQGDPAAIAASGAASNPVYQSIQVALNQADVDLAALRGQIGQHRAKVSELQRRLDTAPKVEADFAQLNRDYDVNKAQYSSLLASFERARIGEKADSAGSVRFEIVQPPTVGAAPVAPLRGLMLAGVLMAALAAGGALAFWQHRLRPVISSMLSLSGAMSVPILGVVTSGFPGRTRSHQRRSLLLYASALSCLLLALGVALFMSRAGMRLVLPFSGSR